MIRLTTPEDALPIAQQLINDLIQLVSRLHTPAAHELQNDLQALYNDCTLNDYHVDVAFKGQLSSEMAQRVTAFMAPALDDTVLCSEVTASLRPISLPNGCKLRLCTYSADDPPVRRAVKMKPPILLFVVTESAMADADTVDDLEDLCEHCPYVTLILPQSHANASKLVATAQRTAWHAAAIDLAVLPARGFSTLLLTASWEHAAALMHIYAVARALDAAGHVLTRILAQESERMQTQRAHNQQQTAYVKRQGVYERTNRPERQLRPLYRRRFDEFQRQADQRIDALLEARTGTIYGEVDAHLNTLALEKVTKAKSVVLRVPEEFQKTLAELVGDHVSSHINAELQQIEELFQTVTQEVRDFHTDAGLADVFPQLQYQAMDRADIEHRLERRIQIERSHEGRLSRAGIGGALGMARRFAYFNPMNPLSYVTLVTQAAGVWTDRQAQAEAEAETLVKVRESLRTEISRVLDRVHREWSGFLKAYLTEQQDHVVPQIESAIEAYQDRKSLEAADREQRLQRQLQGLDNTRRDVDQVKQRFDMLQRDVGDLASELRKLFNKMSAQAASNPRTAETQPPRSSLASSLAQSVLHRREASGVTRACSEALTTPTTSRISAMAPSALHRDGPDSARIPTPPPTSSNPAPLFSIGGERQCDLEARQLSDAFRAAFADHGVSLSESLIILNPDKGRRWRIMDRVSRQWYDIEKAAEQFHIYAAKR